MGEVLIMNSKQEIDAIMQEANFGDPGQTQKFLEDHNFESDEETDGAEKIENFLKEHVDNGALEYLVRGAKLACRLGSGPNKLNLPKCHGVYITTHPVVHWLDCIPLINIPPFGICKATQKPCIPAIVGVWRDTYAKTRIVDNGDKNPGDRQIATILGCNPDCAKPKGEDSLTTLSFLICALGGLIEPQNSGQETVSKPESGSPPVLDENGTTLCVPQTSVGKRSQGPYDEHKATVSNDYLEKLEKISELSGMDPFFLKAAILHESGFQEKADNGLGFHGMAQIATTYLPSYLNEDGAYYNDWTDLREWAIQEGANFGTIKPDSQENSLKILEDPLSNAALEGAFYQVISTREKFGDDYIGIINRLDGGSRGQYTPSAYEIMYYRDYLAHEAGEETWYVGIYYDLDGNPLY